MHSPEASPKPLIYVATSHPLVYQTVEKILPSYRVKAYARDLFNDYKEYNWMLIVDTHSVREWLAVVTECGFQQGRPILILADELKIEKDELRLVYLGVRGIVPITNLERDLIPAVGSLMEGGLWLRRATLSEHLMRTGGCFNAFKFSVREEQIFAFLVNGSSNKEIGNTLGISNRTVKFHVSNILRKFKVKNRRELLNSREVTAECPGASRAERPCPAQRIYSANKYAG
jgi:DNA-binding CsgD family transcriptional regulator